MQTNSSIQKNRVYAPIIVGIVLLLLTLIAYPQYMDHLDTSATLSVLEKTKAEKQKLVDEIKEMQTLFAGSGSSDFKTKVNKFNHRFNTSDIMEIVMLNKFTKSSALTPAAINIWGISVSPGNKLPSWLSLGSVSINISADSPTQIIDYITYLTTESALPFTIDGINLPLDTTNTSQSPTAISLSISLGVYYYE